MFIVAVWVLILCPGNCNGGVDEKEEEEKEREKGKGRGRRI